MFRHDSQCVCRHEFAVLCRRRSPSSNARGDQPIRSAEECLLIRRRDEPEEKLPLAERYDEESAVAEGLALGPMATVPTRDPEIAPRVRTAVARVPCVIRIERAASPAAFASAIGADEQHLLESRVARRRQ